MSKLFDVSISLRLECTVRAQSPQDAEGLAIQLAERFGNASQGLSGSAYAADDVMGFSVNFDPETFESAIFDLDELKDIDED